MNMRAKTVSWTLTLVLLVVLAIGARFEWMGLFIPGVLLIWCALVAGTRQDAKALQKSAPGGLH